MADVSVIAGAVSSLKAASDIVRGMADIRDGALLQARVIELQRVILNAQADALSAQSSQFELLERIRELELELKDVSEWCAEAKRYELRDFGGNTFAYALRETQDNTDPAHRLCSNCFGGKQKSILQMRYRTSAEQDVYFCAKCTTTFHFGVYVSAGISGSSPAYKPEV